MVLFQTWFNMGKVSPWENFLRQNPIREAFTVNIYLQTQRFYDSSVEMFNFNNFFSLTFFLFKVQLFETKSNKREFIVNTQTFFAKWGDVICIKFDVFVQIEQLHLSRLKRFPCPNWKNVFVQIEHMYLSKLLNYADLYLQEGRYDDSSEAVRTLVLHH